MTRRDVRTALILLPLIVLEVYEVRFGSMIQSVKASPSVLLYLALGQVIYSAWSEVQFEYFPKLSSLSRKTQIWFISGLNLGAAALIVIWLEPRFALPVVISIFVIADLIAFQVARDLIQPAPRPASV